MKLIGSQTSPYVRKVRLILGDTNYEFEQLKALTPEGASKLASYGPIRRIPILEVDGLSIFDSSIICEYLLGKKDKFLTINQKLNLKLIDELCDSSIMLFQQKIWKIDLDWESTFSKRLHDRSFGVLTLLNTKVSKNELSEIENEWLYCVLDWLSFRNVYDWQKNNPDLLDFFNSAKLMDKYLSTKLEN
jgi:glutathione S-transferase